jgi:hypothetical protein
MARRTLAGESLASLCRELNERGIPTAAGGGRWNPTTLRRILIGPHLAGLRVYGEQLYPAAWPAILAEDTHHALRVLLTDPPTHHQPPAPHQAPVEWAAVLRALRQADVRPLSADQAPRGEDAALPP